jgi:HD-like signal output (HDOD) protein/CheY-like chemotaxis protein
MKSILFVDDDPLVLQGLRRMLHSMRGEWDMRFANGGAEALEMMAAKPADVVISDMRMPGMNGAELLNNIMRLYPKAVRFILSGYSDTEMTMQCVGGTHQFLSKPCNAEMLKSAVTRALEMDRWLGNDELKALISQMTSVPCLPSLYFQILQELRSPLANLETVGSTIAQDPAMTAKILQLINSAFFGLSRRVSDPTEAVMQLGLDTVKSLVLAVHVFTEYETRPSLKKHVEALQHHSLSTAIHASLIASMENQDRNVVGECFTAGLLHDIGKLVLVANLPEACGQAEKICLDHNIPIIDAERQVFKVSHAEVGGYLLGLWGLPITIVESALFHHRPSDCHMINGFSSLAAVHIANMAERENGGSLSQFTSHLEKPYLEKAGLWERLPAYWEAFNKMNEMRKP